MLIYTTLRELAALPSTSDGLSFYRQIFVINFILRLIAGVVFEPGSHRICLLGYYADHWLKQSI
jgi:hypothetical protein